MANHQTTKQDVADLLENFQGYVNPDGVSDPWFTLTEINQQFAWDDIPDDTLKEWLGDLFMDGHIEVELQQDGEAYRWLS